MKTRIPYGQTKDRILAVIEEAGGMTRAEIQKAIGLPREHVSAVISRLSKAGKRAPKRVYVSHYVNDQEGERKYPRAVYCLGDNPDAKRPKRDSAKVRREWSKMHLRRMKNSSVFNLGVPRTELYKRGKIGRPA